MFMKIQSIKLKILVIVVLAMLVVVAGGVYLVNHSYEHTKDLLAKQVLKNSIEAFNNMEDLEVRTLSATLRSLTDNQKIKDGFILKDRAALYNLSAPLFKDLKEKFHITHWYFIYPETDPEPTAKKCFLRVHNSPKHGDVITRFTYEGAVKSKDFSAGKELGKTAFALRVVSPYYSEGKLIGYMELGQEIDHFLGGMKEQTGSDYGLIIAKQYLDKEKWASVRESKGLRNNWPDQPNVLLVDKTDASDDLLVYEGDITQVPAEGKIVRQLMKDNKFYVQGIFPVFDAGKRKVGGVIMSYDMTALYNNLKETQQSLICFSIVLISVISFLIFLGISFLLNRRFKQAEASIVNVLGGNFDAEIVPAADDEISQFEKMFEQFRQILVDTLNQLNNK